MKSRGTPTEPEFTFVQHIKHQKLPSSLSSTPRASSSGWTPRTPEAVDDGVPEGFLASEGNQQLSASFSASPPTARQGVAIDPAADVKLPTVTAVDLVKKHYDFGGTESSYSLCVGDSLGRVDHLESRTATSTNPRLSRRHSHQAFVSEFDCLTSSRVDERVCSVRHLQVNRAPGVVSYLAANERTVKLFRVRQENSAFLEAFEENPQRSVMTPRAHKKIVMPSRVYTGRHKNPIQDVSVCADEETFMSLDDLQIFWWHLESPDTTKAPCLLDLKPASGKMNDVNELVTTAAFHPKHASLFLVGRSNGGLNVGDLRDPPTATPRKFGVNFQLLPCHNTVQHRDHDDILTSVNCAAFLGAHYVISRDFLALKLWDARYPSGPVGKKAVMEFLGKNLESLYDSDAIFDRFPIAVDQDTYTVVTGCYGGIVCVWNPRGGLVARDMKYFQMDPYVPPDESVRGGEISADDVEEMFANGVSPDQRDLRVSLVSVCEGGERFCASAAEHLYHFSRR